MLQYCSFKLVVRGQNMKKTRGICCFSVMLHASCRQKAYLVFPMSCHRAMGHIRLFDGFVGKIIYTGKKTNLYFCLLFSNNKRSFCYSKINSQFGNIWQLYIYTTVGIWKFLFHPRKLETNTWVVLKFSKL